MSRFTGDIPAALSAFRDRTTLRDPVVPKAIRAAEKRLGIPLCDSLSDFLKVSDGIDDEYGMPLVWNLDELVKVNLEFRKYPDFKDLYMPFDSMLFFGAYGNGDQFFYPILNGKIRNVVFNWNHENDSRTWIANSLMDLLIGVLEQKIQL